MQKKDQPDSWQHQQVKARACLLVEHANLYYRRRMLVPEILFDLKGATAGQLITRTITRSKKVYQIRLNHRLMKDNMTFFLDQVLPHEIAHMVVDRVYGARVKPHGIEWQSVMRQCFRVDPARCHSLEVEPARQHRRDYIYRCDCQQHEFTARRHKNAQKGSQYICRTCGSELMYEGLRSEV